MKERSLQAESLLAVVNCATHDLAQNVIAPDVARRYAVSNRERSSASMVRDYSHRHAFRRIVDVRFTDEPGDEIDDRLNEICVVVRLYTLKHSRQTFKPCAGIDRRGRKRIELVRAGLRL